MEFPISIAVHYSQAAADTFRKPELLGYAMHESETRHIFACASAELEVLKRPLTSGDNIRNLNRNSKEIFGTLKGVV